MHPIYIAEFAMHHIHVTVSNYSSYSLQRRRSNEHTCQSMAGPTTSSAVITLSCQPKPVCGRYVTVSVRENGAKRDVTEAKNSLRLCEVEVFGEPGSSGMNVIVK